MALAWESFCCTGRARPFPANTDRPPKPNMANPSGRAERDEGGRRRKSHPPGGPDFCVCPWGMLESGSSLVFPRIKGASVCAGGSVGSKALG